MAAAKKKDKKAESDQPIDSKRETIESVAMAIILAFIFRAFIVEAFVIPTGSMASTLQGRHMDLDCPQCGYRYQAGASSENPDTEFFREIPRLFRYGQFQAYLSQILQYRHNWQGALHRSH